MKYILFTSDPREAARAWKAGIRHVLIDWETRGKNERQHGYHLECNSHSIEDLKQVRSAYQGALICRINPVGPATDTEINLALDHGTDMIMLPMFKGAPDVERFLRSVNGRCRTILLVETKEALENIINWYHLPFDEFYFGLNDLGLSYQKKFCYEMIREMERILLPLIQMPGKPYGIGGITVLGAGYPLPSMMILKEIVRMGATRVILRRSFKRDAARKNWAAEIERINNYIEMLKGRNEEQQRTDRRTVLTVIQKIAVNLE